MKNFSKTVVRGMVIMWFIGAVYGAAIVMAEVIQSAASTGSYSSVTIHLPELLTYIGMPVSGAIVGYLAKSAFENREKIKINPNYYSGERNGDVP